MLSLLPRRQVAMRHEHHPVMARRPFGPALDQRFVYPSRSYVSAVGEVRLALQQREGLVVVTGGTGSGKTMLCRTLLQQLDAPVHVSVILDPCITSDALLLQMLTDFGVIQGDSHAAEGNGMPLRRQMMAALQRFLASLASTGGYAVVVIDEAQHLRRAVLEQIRLLLNLETDETKLLQVVLVGQPDLDQLLRQPEMQQLDQRVARRCQLEPLTAHEVGRYIERRMTIAQRLALDDPQVGDAAWDVSFTPAALRAVATRSQGTPRVVNLVCDRALEIALTRRTQTIDGGIVREALKRIDAGGTPRFHFDRGKGVAALGAMTVAVAALTLWSLSPAEPAAAAPALFAAGESLTDGAGRSYQPVAFRELPVVDSFNIVVSSSRVPSTAQAVAAQLEAAALPVSILQQGPWHQVIVGPYISEVQAASVQKRLAALGHPGTDLFVEGTDSFTDQSSSTRPSFGVDATRAAGLQP